MALKLTRHRFHPLHISYRRPIRWAGHLESGVDILLLVLETNSGLHGVGETPVRLNWHADKHARLAIVLVDAKPLGEGFPPARAHGHHQPVRPA